MNGQRNVEHVLQRWLVDGVDQMPDRVYLSILDRVERQPQRRAWRVPWRDSTVNNLKPFLAVAAVVVIAVGGLALLARPSGSNVGGPVATSSPSPDRSAAPTAAPTAAASQAWGNPQQCGDAGCGGPLEAGTYTSTSFRPAVTYTVTTPWVNNGDWDVFFQLYPDTLDNRANFSSGGLGPHITMASGITVSPSGACPSNAAQDRVEVDAAALVDYLATRDDVTASAPVNVEIGGLTGKQIDVGLKPGSTGCIPGPLDEDSTSDHYRLIVLDRSAGSSLAIKLSPWQTDFEEFLAEAMPVVQSFEFDLSQEPTPSPS